MVLEVTAENFDSVIKENKFILIDCWSERCPPCRMLAPIIEELAEKHAGKIVFGKALMDDIDNQQIAARFNINVVPTMLVFRDGELVDTFVGLVSKEVLEEKLGLE